jgi:uncharacterized protein YkwD
MKSKPTGAPINAVAAARSRTNAQRVGRDVQVRLATAASFVLALGVLLSQIHTAGAAPGQSASANVTSNVGVSEYCASSEEIAFLTLINDYRRANGLKAFVLSQTLGAAAEHHSKSMADHNYFSHTLIPEGISWSQNMTNHGYDFSTYRGENIVAGTSTAQRAFDKWKASAGHRANMLNSNYRAIGIGRVYNASSTYDYYWTTTFGGVVDSTAVVCGGSDSSGIAGSSSSLWISSSGRTSNSRSSSYCLDGRQDTSWYTTVATPPSYAYVWFDLGMKRSISSIKWKFNRTGYADSFEIQISNDRANWTTIAKKSNAPSDSWQTLSKGVTTRYVRFFFRNPNKDAKLGYVSEVRIYP